MPVRLLREGILDSDAVNQLTAPEEVFYRRLMSVVDDYGRFDGRAVVLRSRLYALKPAIRDTDISHWIAACVKAGLIAVYERDGKPYILFHKIGQPRAEKSKWPAPPPELESARASESGCAQPHADVPYSISYSDSISGAGSGAGPPPTHNGHSAKKPREPLESARRVIQSRAAKRRGNP